MARTSPPSCKEFLDQGIQFPDEGPSSKWCTGGPKSPEEDKTIRFIDSEFDDKIETDEDAYCDHDDEYENDGFIGDHDNDGCENDSLDANAFYIEMKIDPTHRPRSMAFSERGLEY